MPKLTASAIKFGETLELAAVKSVIDKVKKLAASVRCVEHGKTASITVHGRTMKSLRFEVSACCDSLKEQICQKIGVTKG